PFTILLFSFSFSCSAHHRDLHSFPTRRSSDLLGDIDLLLRPSDLPAVTGWLRDRGYKPVSSSSPFFSRGVVSFDLHTEIVGSERSEEHTSELQSLRHLVCRLLLEKKKKKKTNT